MTQVVLEKKVEDKLQVSIKMKKRDDSEICHEVLSSFCLDKANNKSYRIENKEVI